ncbi:MAG: hypothetical protein J5819_10080 [Eubacterium sp.]|nr:hypothetical protein [Eubacterium sp.]
MVKLDESDLRTFSQKSSKGNQLKFKKNDYWYKADYTGYEGLSEYIVSEFLRHSNLSDNEYVFYETEEIHYGESVFRGCRSHNFLSPGKQIITLERLFKNQTGESLYKSVWSIREDNEQRLRFLVDRVESITGLIGFGSYMAKLMTIDAFFLNEDRHLHNIAVIMTETDDYELCPIFDQGAALLADTTLDYPLNADLYDLYPKVKPKTFHADFDEQLDAAEKLYGDTIHFSITKKQVEELLEKETHYPEDIKVRVRDILFHQMEKYGYLV